MITFYDIPSRPVDPTITVYSPNTWKTRFCLNYKGLPYKTEWVEYPDIVAVYQKYDVFPPDKSKDGTPYYCLPLIHDDSTGQTVADSFAIAKYLDKTYPDTPSVLFENEEGGLEKQEQVVKEIEKAFYPIYPTVFKATLPILHPASRAHFSTARAKNLSSMSSMYNQPSLELIHISEEEKENGWKRTEVNYDALAEKFGGKEKDTWFLGDRVSFADFVLAGRLIWIHALWGSDSAEWARVSSWNNGKWRKLLNGLKDYQASD